MRAFFSDGVTDRCVIVCLLLAYALLLLATWQRWTQPLIDHGREMNLPARIANGEQLYRDVQFLYGPLAPYANALLYRVFGAHLAVLQISGAICGGIILLLLYWLARQLMNVPQATVTAALILVTCVLKGTGSYVQPYAFAALYGLLCALLALACSVRFMQSPAPRWMLLAGVCAGFSVLSKPEAALGAWLTGATAWLAMNRQTQRVCWRAAFAFVLPVIALIVAAFGFILTRVPWQTLLNDNHILFTAMPPSLIFFNRDVSGLAYWPQSFWYTASGLGMFAVWWGGSVTLSALWARHWATLWRSGLPWLLGGWLSLGFAFYVLHVERNVTPFAAAVLVLPCVIAVCLWHWRNKPSSNTILLLLYAVFSLCGILRGFLKIRISGPYAPFFIPLLIVVFLYLLLEVFPNWQIADAVARRRTQQVTLVLLALMALGMGVNSVLFLRRTKSFPLETARGRMVVEPRFGPAMAQALDYIAAHTRPDDPVLCLPQATTLNFLAARRYPFFPEIVHPGFVAGAAEDAAVARLARERVPMIVIVNFDTSEFRERAFGVDYNQRLMSWIESHYRRTARFDTPENQGARLGDAPFFIQVYEFVAPATSPMK